LAFVGTMVVPGLAAVLLLAIPWIDRRTVDEPLWHPVLGIAALVTLGAIILAVMNVDHMAPLFTPPRMAEGGTAPDHSAAPVRHVLAAVKIQESLFALPFAYVGMMLAAGGLPPGRSVLWVTLAMVGARNAGMAFNRVLDRHFDALNPRTASRHLPRGVLQAWEL